MRRKSARARTTSNRRTVGKRRMAVMAGLAVVCLGGVGAVIPAVMAGVRTAPAAPVPRGWPAAKASRLRAENQLRQAAAARPVLPPPALPAAGPFGPAPSSRSEASSGSPRIQRQSAKSADSGAQASLGQGIVPLTAGGPFRPSRFLGTNLWNGLVRGRWEVIQAGGVPADQSLGAASPAARAGLFVYTRSPDPASAAAPRITGVRAPSPDPRGQFTVRTVHGDVLTLSLSGSPRRYHFNVVTLRFSR